MIAEQTHGRLSVGEAKIKSPKVHLMSSGLILCLTPGGEQQSGSSPQMLNRTGRGGTVTGAEMVCFLITNGTDLYLQIGKILEK